MAAPNDNATQALREELAELLAALARKRNEVSNLKVGYVRSVEGVSPIPSAPLRHNLVAARAELTAIEQRLTTLRAELGEPEPPVV